MLFNSYEFILFFFPVTFILFYLLHFKVGKRSALTLLFAASLVFYSWWELRDFYIIVISLCVNFFIAKFLVSARHQTLPRKLIFIAGLAMNVAVIFYYKYAHFFAATANDLLGTHFQTTKLVLPLGISFYTFVEIAYLVDSYQRKQKYHEFIDFGLFVTFFPHLIAGPIVHHSEIMPQFTAKWERVFPWKKMLLGSLLFSIGLFKKVIIADSLSKLAVPVFSAAAAYTLSGWKDAWMGSLAYTFQLYFDFSGYSDMAIGLALIFGVKFPLNFNSPYKALSITDFWRRWHMTLSRFLRDYIYIPLGGNRKGPRRTLINLMLTMLIGGLWHGAAWTFVIWGGLHGLYLIINKLWSDHGLKMPGAAAWIVTFLLVDFTWVIFRADSFHSALQIYAQMFNFSENGTRFLLPDLGIVLAAFAISLSLPGASAKTLKEVDNPLFKCPAWMVALAAILFMISFVNLYEVSEFLYFNF